MSCKYPHLNLNWKWVGGRKREVCVLELKPKQNVYLRSEMHGELEQRHQTAKDSVEEPEKWLEIWTVHIEMSLGRDGRPLRRLITWPRKSPNVRRQLTRPMWTEITRRLVSSRLVSVTCSRLAWGWVFYNCVCVCVMTAYRTYLSETVNRKKKRGEEEQSQDGKEWWR